MPSETIWARAGAAAIQHDTLACGLDRSVAGVQAKWLRVGFVMEKILGHVTWYQNLRRAVEALDTVDARWVETTLYDSQGRLERVPGLPDFARAGARAWLDVHRGLRGRPCDVLLFNTQKSAMLCQWDMLRTPTMLMTDVTPIQYDRLAGLYDHDVDENPVVRTLKHQANVLNFHLARALIPCSTWTRDSMIRDYGVPPERVHVVPIGVDTDYWRPAGRPRAGCPVRLLFVGGHFERKGGQLLFDVFRALGLAERAELHVVTRDVVEAAPGVVVHRNLENNTPELLRLYQEADAFVLPTLADCFSNASIEALATGLPVITTAMGGIPDIVEHGATGYLLAPNDGRQLGEALQRVVDNTSHRLALGAAGRARALARFDARTNVARILELARAISANSSPPPSQASHGRTPRTS